MPEILFTPRDFFYPARILRLRRELERMQWASAAARERQQMKHLRRVLAVAHDRVPHYRDLMRSLGIRPADVRRPEDLARLPILTKTEVRRLGAGLLALGPHATGAKPCTTSGTTGEPLTVFLDSGSRALEFVYYWRHWGWAGYRLGNRFAQLNAQEFAERPGASPVRFDRVLNRVLLDSGSLSDASAKTMVAALRKHRPRFLKGLTSPLYYFARILERAGITDIRFDAVFSTGETLLLHRRRALERVFGRVLDSYGLIEQAAAISECPDGGLHVCSDYSVVELLPAQNGGATDSSPGRFARVLGTTLQNLAMPLLRYDTGDSVELAPPGARCPCGRTLPLVRAIHGRLEDIVVTPDGRYVSALFLVLESAQGVEVAQFVQEDERTLSVRVVPAPSFGTDESEALLSHTRYLVGDAMKVRIERVGLEAIERGRSGKVPLVVSRVASAQATSEATL